MTAQATPSRSRRRRSLEARALVAPLGAALGALAVLGAIAALAAIVAPAPARAAENELERLEAQSERLRMALVDSDLEKESARRRAWEPYYGELWGNTPEARQATQTAFDDSEEGAALRARIAEVADRVERARRALEALESSAQKPPADAERLEIERARVVLQQTRLEADAAVIDYHRALGAFVKREVTGWTDWVKDQFYGFAETFLAPFFRKMGDELVSEAQSRAAEAVVNKDLSKLNPGVGAGEWAKGTSKLVKMAIKSGMDAEMRSLFHKRLNELAAASGYDPIPFDITSYWFNYFILAKAEAAIEKDKDLEKKFFDKTLKAVLKKVLKDEAGNLAATDAARAVERQFIEEFTAEWKRALDEAHRDAGRLASTPEGRERILAAARDRVKRELDARRDTYQGEIRKRLTEEMTKRFEAITKDPKVLTDGLSVLDQADFAVNDVAVPLLTVWMNGAEFEAIVENELFKYHIVDEFVKRKTNSRMTLSLFREWYPRYEEIARWRDRWDLVVRVDSLEVPASPAVPFLVTLHYSVRGVSALSEMKMKWSIEGPASRAEWESRTTFADEYEAEKGSAQPARWEWLLTSREVPEPGAYTVGVEVRPNYAPLGENPIAGPKLLGWTASRTFTYGSPDSARDSTAAVAVDSAGGDSLATAGADSAGADSAAVAAADSAAAADSLAAAGAADSARADSLARAAADSAALDSLLAAADSLDPDLERALSDTTLPGDDELDALLDGLEDEIAGDVDVALLLAEFDRIAADLAAIAGEFDAARSFFDQRLNEGREAACGQLGLAYAFARARERLDDYGARLTRLEEIAAILGAAAAAGAPGAGDPRVEEGAASASATAVEMEGALLVEMQGALDTFGCNENDLVREGDQVADPGADPDAVGLGGYSGGGTEICGDGTDNDGDAEIDECDAGCCEGKNVLVTVSDCGNAADDVFLIAVDGGTVGVTPKGSSNTVSLDLAPGTHTVAVTTLDDGGEPGVADDIGTFAATVVVEGVETVGGAGCSELALGATASFEFTVSGGIAKAERSVPAAGLAPVGKAAGSEGR